MRYKFQEASYKLSCITYFSTLEPRKHTKRAWRDCSEKMHKNMLKLLTGRHFSKAVARGIFQYFSAIIFTSDRNIYSVMTILKKIITCESCTTYLTFKKN